MLPAVRRRLDVVRFSRIAAKISIWGGRINGYGGSGLWGVRAMARIVVVDELVRVATRGGINSQ